MGAGDAQSVRRPAKKSWQDVYDRDTLSAGNSYNCGPEPLSFREKRLRISVFTRRRRVKIAEGHSYRLRYAKRAVNGASGGIPERFFRFTSQGEIFTSNKIKF